MVVGAARVGSTVGRQVLDPRVDEVDVQDGAALGAARARARARVEHHRVLEAVVCAAERPPARRSAHARTRRRRRACA